MVKFLVLATRQTSVNAHNSAFWSHFITVSSVQYSSWNLDKWL